MSFLFTLKSRPTAAPASLVLIAEIAHCSRTTTIALFKQPPFCCCLHPHTVGNWQARLLPGIQIARYNAFNIEAGVVNLQLHSRKLGVLVAPFAVLKQSGYKLLKQLDRGALS
jgi:hypothetical protein